MDILDPPHIASLRELNDRRLDCAQKALQQHTHSKTLARVRGCRVIPRGFGAAFAKLRRPALRPVLGPKVGQRFQPVRAKGK